MSDGSMNEENYLNLNEADKDRYVYRIISTERLYELFANSENVLVRPSNPPVGK